MKGGSMGMKGGSMGMKGGGSIAGGLQRTLRT